MRKTIARYLSNYDTCARIKPVRYALYGLLKLIQIPVTHWSSVSMDYITGLPESGPNKFDSILVVVDYLTKIVHYMLWVSVDTPCLNGHHGLADHY